MFKINLLTAIRNLAKTKIVSGINIFGLTVGITCAVFAIVFAYHELTFENCHSKADRVCRVYTYGKFGSFEKLPFTFGKLADDIEQYVPEVKTIARTRTIGTIVYNNGKPYNEDNLVFSEPSLFDILDFNILLGTKPQSPYSLLISEKMAKKYFGSENPVDKTLQIQLWSEEVNFIISGVYADFPTTTHFGANAIIPFELGKRYNFHTHSYHSTNFGIYTLLHDGVDYKNANLKLAQNVKPNLPIKNLHFALVPIKRIHIHENINENAKTNLYLLLIGGFIALLITLFNYINASTILFSTRTKEIGIRKSAGGTRKFIFFQFLTESWLSVTISFVLALILSVMIFPHFSNLMDIEISIVDNYRILLMFLATYLFTIIAAGFYPSLKSVSVRTIQLLNKRDISSHRKSKLGNALITAQFIIAILVLQFIIITERQTKFMFAEDQIKFDGENVICINGHRWGNLNYVKEELLKDASIEGVSWGRSLPASGTNITSDWGERGNLQPVNVLACEEDYFKVFKIPMKTGEFFTNETLGQKKLIINPLTEHYLDFDDPVGQQINYRGSLHTIIGVCEKYLSVPPVFENMPQLIVQAGNVSDFFIIRVNPLNRQKAHNKITAVLTKANPDFPVNLKYYDEIVIEQGRSFINTELFIRIFSYIIMFNAMLGLFAMSLFMAEQRTKEVGVRKVCGATAISLYWSLSKSFLTRLLYTLIIIIPMAYLMGKMYISTFTIQMKIGAGIFIVGALFSALMVLFSTAWKTLFVAYRNPVEALRYE